MSSYSAGDRTRAFLKVQDGCDYNCSYCTIPLARGVSRSDSIEHVAKQCRDLAQKGIREIVLTGVNLGDFREAENGVPASSAADFFALVKVLDNIEGIDRFRISSIEPNLLTDEIIEFVATAKRFVPHFHIPLQSGSNKILKLMRRRYLRELYVERVQKIKSLMPGCCIGVDVITGFPGENEIDFLETYDFIRDLDISYLHVFTYSERENTDATSMSDVVGIPERKRRNKMLRILSEKKLHHFYSQHLDQTASVLFEADNKKGFMHGFTDNYIKVNTRRNESLVNQIAEVRLHSIASDGSVSCELTEAAIFA